MANKNADQQKKLYEQYRASIKARHELRQWYQTSIGKAFADAENAALEEILPNLFGYHLVQVSVHGKVDYLSKSLIRHKVLMDIDGHHLDMPINLNADAPTLPISSDSVDVCLLHHTLDIDMAPHQVLREADRILVPEGRVMILGFNRWSPWGLRHAFNLWHGDIPYSSRFVSYFRIKDWLVLLGFEVESICTFYHRPPFSHSFFIQKMQFLETVGEKLWPAFGAGYLLVARKQVSNLTPIRPRWFLRRRQQVSPGFLETMRRE